MELIAKAVFLIVLLARMESLVKLVNKVINIMECHVFSTMIILIIVYQDNTTMLHQSFANSVLPTAHNANL